MPDDSAADPAGAVFGPRQALFLALLLALAAAAAASRLVLDRYLVFDDSFMSYRYARHLATGVGLRWNPGESPVEGYTNFLLVVLLAPFVRFGADPLLVTRILSVAAALGIAGLMFIRSRRSQPPAVAFAVAVTFAAGTSAFSIAMVGLETVLFAALVFLAYHFATDYLRSGARRDLARCAVTLFAAVLTRPEALFLAGLVSAVAFIPDWRAGRLRGHAVAMLGFFWLPLALYLGWKLYYFGSVLPNPAYVKVGHGGLLSELGTNSVTDFLLQQWKLLALSVGAALLPYSSAAARARLLASSFVLVYVAFFLHVDTLMDIYDRFLFPAAPLIFELGRPLLERAYAACLRAPARPAWLSAGAILFVFVAFPDPGGSFKDISRALHRDYDHAPGPEARAWRGHYFHMRAKAKALGAYPGVEQLLVASVDAGVLPYFSGVRHLDTAGLNDSFIARNHDLERLTGYFFGRHPDIILERARVDGTLITYGHGPLGNTARWATEAGWNDYLYVGSITDIEPSIHEMHVFMRRQVQGAPALLQHLRTRFVDRVYPAPPIRLGTIPMATELAAVEAPPGPKGPR